MAEEASLEFRLRKVNETKNYLHVIIMSRTPFKVNLHPIVA